MSGAITFEVQAANGERSVRSAQALARQQTAVQIADLEEQLAGMAEELARRDAIQEEFGAESELAEARREAAVWATKYRARVEESRDLVEKMEALRR